MQTTAKATTKYKIIIKHLNNTTITYNVEFFELNMKVKQGLPLETSGINTQF